MTLTFFFSDLEDSSGLAERLDADYAAVLAEVRELQREIVARAGGEEVDCRGDELFSVFSDANAAAAAALEIQHSFAERVWPGGERVRVRIGLHCGEAERAAGGLSASTCIAPRASARPGTVARYLPRRRRCPRSAHRQ